MVCNPSEGHGFNNEKYDYAEFVGISCNRGDECESLSWEEVLGMSKCVIVDVRPKEQTDIINLKGNNNIFKFPLKQLIQSSKENICRFLNISNSFEEEQIFVFCRSGNSSIRATKYLNSLGLMAKNISGGLSLFPSVLDKKLCVLD